MKTRPDAEPLQLTRRDGLKVLGAYVGGALLAACSPRPTTPDSPTAVSPTGGQPTEVPVNLTPTPSNETPQDGDTKVENGVTYEWHESQEGWFRPLTLGPIPLLDYVDNTSEYTLKDLMPMSVFIAEDVVGVEDLGLMSHQNRSPDSDQKNSFTALVNTDLRKRYFGNLNPLTPEQREEFYNGLQDSNNSTVTFSFKTSTGDYSWGPGPETEYVVYVVHWDDAVPAEGNGFSEWKHPSGNHFRSRVYVDSNGNLVGVIAAQESIESFSPKDIREMILFNFIGVLTGSDLSKQGYISGMGIYSDYAGKGEPPHIEIEEVETP